MKNYFNTTSSVAFPYYFCFERNTKPSLNNKKKPIAIFKVYWFLLSLADWFSPKKVNQMKKTTILSLDGGGIRGIITCIILRYIEEQLQIYDKPGAKLGDYFDFVAGSSTGGLIASIILCPNEHRKAKYSIQKGLELYAEKGGDIFQVSFWERLVNPFGLINEKISQEALEKNLNDFFGSLELKELIKPCLITSYDIENRRAKLFNSWKARINTDNFYVKDVCRATSAAPTYFSPVQIKSLYGQIFSLIDGGMFANNPSLCAYAEARKIPFAEILKDQQKTNHPAVNDMIVISIGTGIESKSYSFRKLEKAGKISWVNPIIDILMSANAETVDYQLCQMFDTLDQQNQKNYYRLNPSLKNASPAMDNVRRSNIENLIQAGLCFIDDNRDILNEIVQKLILHKT